MGVDWLSDMVRPHMLLLAEFIQSQRFAGTTSPWCKSVFN